MNLQAKFKLVLVLTASCVPSLSAQFNGPADTARDTVNISHPITTDPDILFPKNRETLLRAGDLVRVSVYGQTEYVAEGRINEEGLLPVPLISPVAVGDHSVLEARRMIAQSLEAAGMFTEPQVQIQVLESAKSAITVMGEAHGQVPGLGGSRRLFDVLAFAGGLQPTTSHLIAIQRPGLVDTINVDLGTDPERSRYANVPVFPGDTIITSRIGNFYLLGAFKAQGAYPLTSTAPVTLMQVVAAGGGKLFEAKTKDFHLVRTDGTRRTMTLVNFDRIQRGLDPDPVLQADDIIYAPSDKFRAVIHSGGLTSGLGIILTTAAIISTR